MCSRPVPSSRVTARTLDRLALVLLGIGTGLAGWSRVHLLRMAEERDLITAAVVSNDNIARAERLECAFVAGAVCVGLGLVVAGWSAWRTTRRAAPAPTRDA